MSLNKTARKYLQQNRRHVLYSHLLADARLCGSLEGDQQSLPTQGSIEDGRLTHCLVKSSFGSGIHGHVEGFPPGEFMSVFVLVLVAVNVASCEGDGGF